ncbi:MAG: bifunctional (p)ppGpp synthetase/guanosine-3',5'-bis(diphosphate) 3'-pyrophosphohydrolase [Caldilineaceae bacterium]
MDVDPDRAVMTPEAIEPPIEKQNHGTEPLSKDDEKSDLPTEPRPTSSVPRVPLPADVRSPTPLNSADLANRSILLLLRRLPPLPTVDKQDVIQPSASSEEIVAMDGLLGEVAGRFRTVDYDRIARAYAVASYAHRNQRRDSGAPYILHPIAVARILAELEMDPDTIIAALLHDVVEDTEYDESYIEAHFGTAVARLVYGVTKLKKINELSNSLRPPAESKDEVRAESLRKMFLAMADDVRVVLIKLADRLHNMRTLSAKEDHKRRRIARETLDIFAPLANRLGIWPIKSELEDLSFRYLEPSTYKELARQVIQRQPEQEKQIAIVKAQLEQKLAEAKITAQVSGRMKHIYSIHKKMLRKKVPFDQIYDVLAFRIIVDGEVNCYAALGIVHGLWRPIPGEFDDYIANPKENSYRSLHTGVLGPKGRAMEVQIRTRPMHEHAERGIAAHWSYKEQGKYSQDIQKKIDWLRQLLEFSKDIDGNAQDFLATVKSDVISETVFVFTPQGKVIDLPTGATPIDFAYEIHTELGHRCRGATVNGQMVPLDYQLKNGEQVQIISAKRGGPSRDWLNPNLQYVATHRARSKIRLWLKRQARDENIQRGREILDREMHRLSITRSFESVAEQCGYDDLDDFLAAIGYNDINIQQVIQKLLDQENPQEAKTFNGITVSVDRDSDKGLRVEGMGGMLVNLGRCCSPVPDEPIIGYITVGRGVTIHKTDCPNVAHAMLTGNEQRFVAVQWANATNDKVYPVKIHVNAFDRPGLVRDISNLIADEHVNMSDVMALTGQKNNTALIKATLQIKDMGQLLRILTRIERIPNVLDARRVLA